MYVQTCTSKLDLYLNSGLDYILELDRDCDLLARLAISVIRGGFNDIINSSFRDQS